MATREAGPGAHAAFRDLCERFRALEARKAADDANISFAQAQLILESRARLKVPVAVVCAALGLSPESVNTYRNVAMRIDERLFRGLVDERRADGLPLFPWSVIVQVARLPDEGARQELIGLVRLRGWRTRDAVQFVSARRGALGRARTPADVAGRLEKLVTHLEARGTAGPPRLLTVVAEGAARLIAEASRVVQGGRAPASELLAAHDALTSCARVVAEARDAVGRRSGATPAGPGGTLTGSAAGGGVGGVTASAPGPMAHRRVEPRTLDVQRMVRGES